MRDRLEGKVRLGGDELEWGVRCALYHDPRSDLVAEKNIYVEERVEMSVPMRVLRVAEFKAGRKSKKFKRK